MIGNVTNEIPFAVASLGDQFYITTSVGRSFQIYDAATLRLLFVSNTQTSSKITCLHAHFHYVFAAWDNTIGIYKRGKLEHTLICGEDEDDEISIKNNGPIKNLLLLGEYLIATTLHKIFIFKKNPSKSDLKYPTDLYTIINVSSLNGDIKGISHPPTYLNKIVIMTTNNLLIFNIRTGKLLFTSSEISPNSILTCIESSPMLDIIALGTSKGEIIFYNIKKGKITRKIDTREAVSSISFRTDGSSHIAVGLNNGDLLFYDLDRKKRVHLLSNAHKEHFGGIIKVKFLNGQPIIVTTGGDNHLKEYVFDPPLSNGDISISSPPRLLRFRGGHCSPPSRILFSDLESHFLLSSSRDQSFWGFSLRKDAQSHEFSQKLQKTGGQRVAGLTNNLKQKFNEIIDIAYEGTREGEWENIITAHLDETFARTWDRQKARVGRWTLPTVDGSFAKAVAISSCGNFGIVGSAQGGIGVYNLQSGILRKKFVNVHKSSITGVAIDGLNRVMISTSLDGTINFYDFGRGVHTTRMRLLAPINSMVYHRSSDLLAVALDNLSVTVIDLTTKKKIRELWGHSNRITSLDFTPNGRWIISASLDSTIRTWDLPTGGCIDAVKVDNVVTQLKVSPTGDMLATIHVSGVGIGLWTNRAQFKNISTRQVNEDEINEITLPNVSGEGSKGILDGVFDNDEDAENFITGNPIDNQIEQLHDDLITLSVGPRIKFNTLVHLDAIRLRSKPKEAPKKPEKLPFFLQFGDKNKIGTINGADTGKKDEPFSITQGVKPTNNESLRFESEFTKKLRLGNDTGSFKQFLDYLKGLSPSSTDMEIRTINPLESLDELIWFIKAMSNGLKSNINFELIEAWIRILLKCHGDAILENYNKNKELKETISEWETLQENSINRLDYLVKYTSTVSNFLSSF